MNGARLGTPANTSLPSHAVASSPSHAHAAPRLAGLQLCHRMAEHRRCTAAQRLTTSHGHMVCTTRANVAATRLRTTNPPSSHGRAPVLSRRATAELRWRHDREHWSSAQAAASAALPEEGSSRVENEAARRGILVSWGAKLGRPGEAHQRRHRRRLGRAHGGDVRRLGSHLQSLHALLSEAQEHAPRASRRSEALLRSLRSLRSLATDADNLLDEMLYHQIHRRLHPDESITSSNSCSSLFAVQLVEPNNRGAKRARHSGDDDDDTTGRIKDILERMCEAGDDVREAIKMEKLDAIATGGGQDDRIVRRGPTTSYSTEPKVFGRDTVKERIVGMLISSETCGADLAVLPIVGNGGVGKTTLAQLVYSDTRVQAQFSKRIWISVSVDFDEVRLTRELLDRVSNGVNKHGGITNLNKLQEILEDDLKSERLLLVLDDMWEDNDKSRWNKLLAPLRYGDFWLLFKACAFGDEKYEGHPSLQIGQLNGLRELGGSLAIYNLENVCSKEESKNAGLRDKIYLKDLLLSWCCNRLEVRSVIEEEVLESLHPHSGLKYLSIKGYGGISCPTWLSSINPLISLETICLDSCTKWEVLPLLRTLHLIQLTASRVVPTVSSDDCTGSEKHIIFPCLEELVIRDCPELRTLGLSPCSFEAEGSHTFGRLHHATIYNCPQLMNLPQFGQTKYMSTISIEGVGSFPHMRLLVRALYIKGCASPSKLHQILVLIESNLCLLEKLTIESCLDLTYLPWETLSKLVSLKMLVIVDCCHTLKFFPKP
uniref:NB-ARC domain-containing protein n=1 Tax=Oryza meridionalis TaxID=40149 RepID=A0A0E0F579_9ORYZ